MEDLVSGNDLHNGAEVRGNIRIGGDIRIARAPHKFFEATHFAYSDNDL